MELWIAIVVATTTLITSMIAPIAVGYATYRIQRADRREDYARQDLVAQRARAVADSAAQVSEAARQATVVVSDKLDVVHSLVNSQLTAALMAEHDALVGQLSPNAPTTEAVKIIKNRIDELAQILKSRTLKAELYPPK